MVVKTDSGGSTFEKRNNLNSCSMTLEGFSINLGIQQIHEVPEVLNRFVVINPDMNRKDPLSRKMGLFQREGHRKWVRKSVKIDE